MGVGRASVAAGLCYIILRWSWSGGGSDTQTFSYTIGKFLEAKLGIFAADRCKAGGAAFKDCSELLCGGKAVRNVGRSSSTASVLLRRGPPRFDVLNPRLLAATFFAKPRNARSA